MDRNIKITYILSYLKHSWFWAGIWVFYYLKFTDYAGIGLIETVMILTMTFGEIPTGAIGDMVGKKYTMFFALLFEGIGSVVMAISTSFYSIAIAVFLMCIGGSLYSGTSEALLYDSLKQIKKEDKFDKSIANTKSFQYLAVTISSIIGGFLYRNNNSSPFLLAALFQFIGMLICLLISEPLIDSEKFSLKNYISQNKRGFFELFKYKNLHRQTVFLIVIGSISVLSWEVLESILGMEFGFNPIGLSILTSSIFLLSAVGSQLSKYTGKYVSNIGGIIIMTILSVITFLISPFVGLVLGGLTLILRSVFQVISENITSVIINKNIVSKHRSTALSSFNMLKNIPYVLTAYFIGYLMDMITAKVFAFGLGLILIFILVVWKISNFDQNKVYE